MTKMFVEPESGEKFGSSLLGSLGKNLLESGAEQIGSAGAAWVLNSIFGLTSSDAKLDKIQETLNEINGKLDKMDAEIVAIGNAISQLATDLKIDTQKIQTYVDQASLLSPITKIADAYSGKPEKSLTWFADKGEQAAKGTGDYTPAQLLAYAQTAATSVLTGDDELSQPILAINLALMGVGGTDKGLLLDWTNLFISEMGTDGYSTDVYSYYITLENYFQQYLAHQLKGAAVIVNAYCINDTDPQHPSHLALDYLNGVSADDPGFYQMIQEELERFLECAEKLVLSQMNMIKEGATVALPTDAQKVLTRADLFVALYNEAMGGHAPDGLYGRVLTRPSQITVSGGGSQGPQLSPPGYTASNGNVVTASSGYKVVDWGAADQYPVLSSYANSDIKVVRYYWPWPATLPPPNQPLSPVTPFQVAPSYYDKTTLGAASAAGATTAYIASFTDISAINFAPYFSSLLTHPDSWTLSGGDGYIDWVQPSLTSFPISVKVRLEIPHHTHYMTVDTSLRGPLLLNQDANDSPVELRLLIGLHCGYTSYPYHFRSSIYYCGEPDIYGNLTKGSTDGTEIMNTESGKAQAWPFEGTRHDDSPQTYSKDWTLAHDFTVSGGAQYRLQFDLALKGGGELGATADLDLELNYIRLAWPLVETKPA
ncbi:MAG TPA: hypothetical protein VJQ56_11300 [Blastocatellia bacterium]|nr:hypothetical protein [Blastocatellia bacterium]